jgi:hypothetical protein
MSKPLWIAAAIAVALAGYGVYRDLQSWHPPKAEPKGLCEDGRPPVDRPRHDLNGVEWSYLDCERDNS